MDYEKRIDGEKLLEELCTPEIFRSYIMGRMLENTIFEIIDGKLFFSLRELHNAFLNMHTFDLLFPNASQLPGQKTEKDGEVKQIGNAYERTRDNGPNRRPG